jgi:hypothetical protein
MQKVTYRHHSPDGFGSNFFMAMTALNHCLDKKLEPYIDIRNPSYLDPNQNCWDLIFQQPFDISKEDSKKYPTYSGWDLGETLFSYHGDTRNKFQDKEFVSLQRKIIGKYVKPLEHIEEKVTNYWEPYKDKKVLGIHRRGRDHFSSGHASGQNHKMSEEYIKAVVDKYIGDYDYLYLTSDENKVYEFFKDTYPEKFIFFDDKKQFGEESQGLHFLNIDIDLKTEMLNNLILELLILSKCDKILLMNSNISHMSLFFSDHYNYEFYDNHVNYR